MRYLFSIFTFVFILLFVAFCSGCTTTGQSATVITEHTRQITALEERNRELTDRIGKYDSAIKRSVEQLDHIRDRAAGMGGEVDDIIYLFNQYDDGVRQIISELERVQTEIGASQ